MLDGGDIGVGPVFTIPLIAVIGRPAPAKFRVQPWRAPSLYAATVAARSPSRPRTRPNSANVPARFK
jgi:hypothetical protein